MKSWAKWTARTVLVTTGLAAVGGGITGVALAGAGGTNTGNASVLSGNQVNVPVSIPIDLCGNAAAILGIATASCQGGVTLPVLGWSWLGSGSSGSNPQQAGLEVGNLSIGSGNDVQVPVSAPIDVCGNAAAVLGDSSAGCVGGASVGSNIAQTAAAKAAKGTKAAKKVAKSCAPHPTVKQLANVGALPGLASVPALGALANLSALVGPTGAAGTTSGGALLPASTLSALQQNASGSGMSSGSFATLAIGALLAGAAALKSASRRPRARKAGGGEGAA